MDYPANIHDDVPHHPHTKRHSLSRYPRVRSFAATQQIKERRTLRDEIALIANEQTTEISNAISLLDDLLRTSDRKATRQLRLFVSLSQTIITVLSHPETAGSLLSNRLLYQTFSDISRTIRDRPDEHSEAARSAVAIISSQLLNIGISLAAHQLESPLDAIDAETPVVKLAHLSAETGNEVFIARDDVLPGGSGKDRVALALIEDAEQKGRLHPGDTIVEATAGSLGYGLLLVCAAKGYKLQVVMPEKIAETKGQGLRMYGAEIITVPGKMDEAIEKAIEIGKQSGFCHLDEYNNPITVEANYRMAGARLWEAMGGQIDVFIMGRGSGGTLLGIGRYLKEKNPDLVVISAEPSRKLEGKGNIQAGIGALVPTAWDEELDALITQTQYVTDEASVAGVYLLSQESVFGGLTSGTNAVIAALIAHQRAGKGLSILTINPDGFDRNAITIAGFEKRHVPMMSLGRRLAEKLKDSPDSLITLDNQQHSIIGHCLTDKE